jgi:hypothetical protein
VELGTTDDADCTDSRAPAAVSSCSSMLKEGMPDVAAPGIGFRLRDCVRLSVLERLDRRVSKELSGRPVEASCGIGGNALVGAGGMASAIAIVSWKVFVLLLPWRCICPRGLPDSQHANRGVRRFAEGLSTWIAWPEKLRRVGNNTAQRGTRFHLVANISGVRRTESGGEYVARMQPEELAQDDLHGNGKELTTERATKPELPARFRRLQQQTSSSERPKSCLLQARVPEIAQHWRDAGPQARYPYYTPQSSSGEYDPILQDNGASPYSAQFSYCSNDRRALQTPFGSPLLR